jgi:hypothetical protein
MTTCQRLARRGPTVEEMPQLADAWHDKIDRCDATIAAAQLDPLP